MRPKLTISILQFFLFFILFTGFLTSCNQQNSKENTKPYLIVLSMDGFRWDYTDHANTPNFDKIEKLGVKAKAMVPSFPTKTFPNHYTLATGLYPDHHGIV